MMVVFGSSSRGFAWGYGERSIGKDWRKAVGRLNNTIHAR